MPSRKQNQNIAKDGILESVGCKHHEPVATRFDGFGDGQRNQASTWEHMVLTRADVLSRRAADDLVAASGLHRDLMALIRVAVVGEFNSTTAPRGTVTAHRHIRNVCWPKCWSAQVHG
ncbi:MAG: hypothetical protein O2967_21760 [Proteobacteria bacterium]|nr:hypothetical protein [Pseudomonadota bacterium]